MASWGWEVARHLCTTEVWPTAGSETGSEPPPVVVLAERVGAAVGTGEGVAGLAVGLARVAVIAARGGHCPRAATTR